MRDPKGNNTSNNKVNIDPVGADKIAEYEFCDIGELGCLMMKYLEDLAYLGRLLRFSVMRADTLADVNSLTLRMREITDFHDVLEVFVEGYPHVDEQVIYTDPVKM